MKASRPAILDRDSRSSFPPDTAALNEPNGLIAIGGDLAPERLLAAYRRGIFPWYEAGQPILWWTPEPRLILRPPAFHASHSLRQRIRRGDFSIRIDTDFSRVIHACAAPRAESRGTWITREMLNAYIELHRSGIAHSVEVWREERLIGGLYGIALGVVFFGESMFSRENDASKLALHALCARMRPHKAALIDCQVPSAHLIGLGAEPVSRKTFVGALTEALDKPSSWPVQKR